MLLCLIASLVTASEPRPVAEDWRTGPPFIPLQRITPAEALCLDGKVVRARVNPEECDGPVGAGRIYSRYGPGPRVWLVVLAPGQKPSGAFIAEGAIGVTYDGGALGLVLLDARVVRD